MCIRDRLSWPDANSVSSGASADLAIGVGVLNDPEAVVVDLSLIHISEPTRPY